MPGKNEIVAGIRMEGGKEFREELTSINKSIAAQKSELKLVTAEYEGQANSLEALTAKDKALNKILDEQKKKVEVTEKALESAKKAYDENAGSIEKLKDAVEEQQKKTKEAKMAYDTAKQKLEEFSKAGKQSGAAVEKQKEAVAKLEQELKNQKDTLSRAKSELEAGENAYRKLGNQVEDWQTKLNTAQAQLLNANKAVKQNAAYMEEAERSADGCAESIDKFGKTVANVETDTFADSLAANLATKGIEVGLDLLKSGAEAVKDAMIDASKASAQLAAKTGLTEAAASKYKKVMEQIKGDNFGEDYQDVADVMATIIQNMGELNETDMTNITESAITLRDTFGMDIQEQIRAVDVMTKTMGVNATQAFDLIAAGAQNGLDRSGELVDNLTEYGSLWGQAGFSASEAFGIMENGLNAGAYNLDKVNDFVKEFGISLSDGRIEKNINSFSKGTQDLFEKWKNGEASTSDVFYSIIGDLEKMTNKQEALTLASNIWSALGEDNAMQVLTALNDTNEGYENVLGTMEKLKEVKYSDLESAIQNFGSVVQENIVTPIADKALPLITDVINAAANGLENIMDPPKTQVQEFIDGIEESNEKVQELLESAQNTMQGAKNDVADLEAYRETILSLNGVEEKNEFQKYQMKTAVDELSGSIPELAAAFDEESGSIQLTSKEIDNLIKSHENLLLLQAAESAKKESYEAMFTAQLNQKKAENALTEAQKELTAAQEKNSKSLDYLNGGYGEYYREVLDAQIAVDDATEAQDESNKAYAEAKKQYESTEKAVSETTKEMENLQKAQGELSDSAEDAGDAETQFSDAAKDTAATLSDSAEAISAQKSALQSIRDEYTEAVESIKTSLQDKINLFEIFDTSDKGEDVTVEKMTENLNSQIEAFQNYQQNLEAVKDHVGKEISPEFMQYLENMGMEGANTLEHILKTYADDEPEKVKELNDKWMQAMDQTESIAKVSAANQLALKMGLKEMSSTDADFSDLRASIDKAVSSASESWKSLPQATEDALNQAINTAQELGIQIPEGLAEGIASGETSPESAMEQIRAALEGRCEGLLEVANQAGIQVPDEIKTGIEAGGQKAVEAYNALIALLAEKEGDAEEAGKSAGEAQSSGYTAGVKDGQSDTEKASSDVAQAGADAAKEKDSEYKDAGSSAAGQYASGISSGKNAATQEAASMAGQARSAAATYENSFYTAGYNASSGFAEGIRQGKSQAINAAAQMASESLKAAKDAIAIKSPSHKFRDEVGKQVGAGYGLGIKDSTPQAEAAAAAMAQKTYTKASEWLKKYRKDHTVTVEEEKWFWQQLQQQAKAGSEAYKKAAAEIKKLDSSSTITDALAKKISGNFGVSGLKTSGSGKKKTQTSKTATEYQNDVIQAAEKALANYKILHATTETQEIDFWTAVRTNLQRGSKGYTQAWYDITEKIQNLNKQKQEADEKAAETEKKTAEEAAKTRATVQDKILSSYKTYCKVSAKAEVDYWDTARQQFQEGTDARIEADQKYFEAKQDYEEQKLELEKDYADQSTEIEKNRADKEKEIQDNLNSTLQNRKKEILSSMSGFDAWDAEGYVADTMLYNLKTQVEGLKLWENQLEELGKKGLSADIMKELQEMGPEAAANIYTLNQMTAEQLDEFNKLWTEKNELADKQAKEENQDLIKQTHDDLATLRKDTNDQLTKLKADYNTAIADLEQGLSDGLKGLVDQAGSIGEEMVAALVAKLQQAGSAAQTTGVQTGSQTRQNEEPAQEAAGNTQDLEAIEKAQVLTVIASGKAHNKAISTAEKKKHSDLWAYIVKKYGKSVNIAATKQLADILGVEASAKPSQAQLKEILDVMKKKGYSSGTRRILEDQLAWLSEGGSQEYVIRKSDGAVMQNMLRGDKVINPVASDNLYDFANDPTSFLKSKWKELRLETTNQAELLELATRLNFGSIAKMNNELERTNTLQNAKIPLENQEILKYMGVLANKLDEMSEKFENLQVRMDSDVLVGELAPKMSRKLAVQSTRMTRGTIR